MTLSVTGFTQLPSVTLRMDVLNDGLPLNGAQLRSIYRMS